MDWGTYFIANCQKPNTLEKKVHWNTEKRKTRAYRLTKIDMTSDNITDQSDSQKIYASMTIMYSNAEIPIIYFGDSSQLTNWILDSSGTCHMTPDFSDLIPISMVETNKYIYSVDEYFITAKQTG